jgi:hypothetical protein
VFITRNFTDYASDYTIVIQNRKLDDPSPTVEPANPTNIPAAKKWENQEKKREKTIEAYCQRTCALYRLALGQCTMAMKTLLESRNEFHTTGTNGFDLINLIQKLIYSVDDNKIAEYHRKFQTFTEAFEELGIKEVPKAVLMKVAEANGRSYDTANAAPLKWIALTWQGGLLQVCQSLGTKNPQAI